MTKPEWLEIVAEMTGHWPHAVIPDPAIGAWIEMIADLDQNEVRAAVRVAAMDPAIKFPPTGGHLRTKVLGELREDRSTWGEVWEEVLDRISSHGANRESEITWSSELVAELVRLAGFQELCMCDIDSLQTIEAQWRNKWEALRRRSLQERVWKGLPTGGLKRLEQAQAAPVDQQLLTDAIQLTQEEAARRAALTVDFKKRKRVPV